jgi:GT2 family glycosyltransferase
MHKPQLAVVILNWNGKALLEKFLPQVVAYSKPHLVVLGDNASTDDSVSWTKENFPDVQVIINDSNGGFAKGYNDILRQLDAENFLLLNSDVEVTENWLEPLLKQMENKEIAGCQPKILAQERKDEFEHAGASGGFIDKYHFPFCRGRIFEILEKDHGQYDSVTPIFWASGASMLIRSEVFWKLNGFDERFFAHFEEIDMCWRAQRMGLQFVVVPESTVYHLGGGTLNYNNPRKTFLNFRNSLLMIHKNQPAMLWLVLLRRMIIDGMIATTLLLKGQARHFWAVVRAHFAFYGMLGSSRKERKKWKHLDSRTSIGVYHGSIIWAKMVQKIDAFSKLNQRRFK